MNNINVSSFMNNAMSRAMGSQVNSMQARLARQARAGANSTTRTPRSVNGHFVTTGGRNNKKLMKVCKDFESIFVNQLLKSMRKTLNKKNNLVHGGFAEEVFTDMLYTKYSQKAVQSGDFGFANTLYDHFDQRGMLPR